MPQQRPWHQSAAQAELCITLTCEIPSFSNEFLSQRETYLLGYILNLRIH